MLQKHSAERFAGVDVLRGFALWGICVVNLPLLARGIDLYRVTPATAGAQFAYFVNSLLFEAKFFTLFSFLFGLGIYILEKREDATFLARRFLGLCALGLLHGILLFPGDILLSYGLLGFLFLALRRLDTRALAVFAVFCLVIAGLTYALLGYMSQANYALPSTNYLGTYGAAVASNLHMYPVSLGYVMLFNWPGALAMIVLGYLSMRENWIPRIRLSAFSALVVLAGIAGSLLYANASVWQLKAYMPVAMLLMALSAPLTSFFYAQLIFTLASRSYERWPLQALASAGRMSLTNYVLQSVLAGIIFHGYGFGLYNKLSFDWLFLVATGIFLCGVLLSTIWLRFFVTGPLEWLLRSFSHWETMPWRAP